MPSGLSNAEKAKIRQLYAEGKIGRDALLEAESRAYHAPGTCTFYGTANTNQMLMEVMGLHLPGTAFVNPGTPLRDALTAAGRPARGAAGPRRAPARRCTRWSTSARIVNGIVGLLATGGSTNHTLHLVAIARGGRHRRRLGRLDRAVGRGAAAGARLSERQRRREPVPRRRRHGFRDPRAAWRRAAAPRGLHRGRLGPRRLRAASRTWTPRATGLARGARRAAAILPSCARSSDPFSADGGLRVLTGNLGRAVIKISAVEAGAARGAGAGAWCSTTRRQLQAAFKRGELERDFVAVVRFQGPRANGMPELHKLTPTLRPAAGSRLQGGAGHRRAHVGRVGQGAGGDSRDARNAWPAGRWRGCATATCCAWMPSAAS